MLILVSYQMTYTQLAYQSLKFSGHFAFRLKHPAYWVNRMQVQGSSMKKTTFPALGLLAGSLIFLSGCQAGTGLEVSSQSLSEVSGNEAQASAPSSQNEPRSVRENTTQEENAFYNDLLYREYSLGKTVEAGTATITTADILSASDSPSQIVIFRNNEVWKILDYQGKDIKVDIPEDGNYCYMVADENKALWDITELVDMEVIGDMEDWIIPLE